MREHDDSEFIEGMQEIMDRTQGQGSVVCGNCKFYPEEKKTFCKTAKRSVKLTTPADECQFFEVS